MGAEGKAELRRDARMRRDALSADEVAGASAAIVEHLEPLLAGMTAVMSYVAIGSEADVAALTVARLALPRVVGEHLEVAWAKGPLRRGAFGIAEPSGPALDPSLIDVVLVPGLVFDRSGHRVGYGRGYYDRFLARLRPDALTVGVCFQAQLVESLPAEPHDHPVRLVVTEREVVAAAPS